MEALIFLARVLSTAIDSLIKSVCDALAERLAAKGLATTVLKSEVCRKLIVVLVLLTAVGLPLAVVATRSPAPARGAEQTPPVPSATTMLSSLATTPKETQVPAVVETKPEKAAEPERPRTVATNPVDAWIAKALNKIAMGSPLEVSRGLSGGIYMRWPAAAVNPPKDFVQVRQYFAVLTYPNGVPIGTVPMGTRNNGAYTLTPKLVDKWCPGKCSLDPNDHILVRIYLDYYTDKAHHESSKDPHKVVPLTPSNIETWMGPG